MTKKKWIFCTETTYLKILKEKDQLQASQPSHDSLYISKLTTFFLVITGPCEGLHSSKLNSANWIIRKYRKLTSSLSAGIGALSLMFFNENLLFCNLIEAFFSSLKLNFMHDGIVLCLSHLFASLKWRLWSLKWPQSVIKSYT